MEAAPEETPQSLASFYRWGWIPLVGGCVVIVGVVLLSFEVWRHALGFTKVDPELEAFFVTRAVVASLGLAGWAGWFVFRSRRRIEAAREQLRKQRSRLLEEAWKAEQQAGLAAISRILAHDIRNPLNNMALNCTILERAAAGLPPAEAERLSQVAHVLRDETARLDRLVDDYLAYGRGMADHLTLKPLRLSALVGQAVAAQAQELAGRRVEVKLDAEPTEPELQADAELLGQAVGNLLRHAAEAMPRGGEIGVRVRVGPEGGRLEVTDQGPGFEDPGAAFRPFASAQRQGTGLRLAIVRDVVRAHGGEVWAENLLPGAGAKITVRLPLGEAR